MERLGEASRERERDTLRTGERRGLKLRDRLRRGEAPLQEKAL